MKRLMILTSIAMAPVHAENLRCETIDIAPDEIGVIQSQFQSSTHLRLPEEITVEHYSLNELWEGHMEGKHYFINPKHRKHSDGALTSLTLITDTRSYDFKIERVNAYTPHCYIINGGDQYSAGFISRRQGSASTGQSPVSNTSSLVNTSYDYEHPIVSAWDDGRSMQIRFDTRDDGPVDSIVTAGDGSLIDYDYDQATRTFTIRGLYPDLRFLSGPESEYARLTRKRRS